MNNKDYKKLELKWAFIHYQYMHPDYDKIEKDLVFKTEAALVTSVLSFLDKSISKLKKIWSNLYERLF